MVCYPFAVGNGIRIDKKQLITRCPRYSFVGNQAFPKTHVLVTDW
jgi:hypothetical protein